MYVTFGRGHRPLTMHRFFIRAENSQDPRQLGPWVEAHSGLLYGVRRAICGVTLP